MLFSHVFSPSRSQSRNLGCGIHTESGLYIFSCLIYIRESEKGVIQHYCTNLNPYTYSIKKSPPKKSLNRTSIKTPSKPPYLTPNYPSSRHHHHHTPPHSPLPDPKLASNNPNCAISAALCFIKRRGTRGGGGGFSHGTYVCTYVHTAGAGRR